jgi:KDO2-lipid IV(A) lauroyltransferase
MTAADDANVSPAATSWQQSTPTLRFRAAAFWVNSLFLWARYIPWALRPCLPFWIAMTWFWSPYLRMATQINAGRLLGDRDTPRRRRRLARAIVRNFYLFVYDIGRARGQSLEQVLARLTHVEGDDHYAAARAAGKGVIVITAHLGSYEVGIAGMRVREPKVHVLFQRDRMPRFDDLRDELHTSLGIENAVVGGVPMWEHLCDALRRNEAVLIQADRVMPGQRGMKVPFGNGHIELPLGPIKLARLTGAPLLPIFAIRQPDGNVHVHIEPAIHVTDADHIVGATARDGVPPAMRAIASVLEKYIFAYPEQWLVLYRAWCEDQQPGNL